MKTFKVYKHPTQGFEAVKAGFCWPAIFFTLIWMLLSRLWGLAALWFVLYFSLDIVEKITNKSEESALQEVLYLILFVGYLALVLIPGFKGNSWREKNLVGRDYVLVNTVEAGTKDAAVAHAANT